MSEQKRVHNPDRGELVYNAAGQIVAGCTSVDADLSDPVTSRLVRLGRLIVPTEPAPEPEVDPEVAPEVAPVKTSRKRAQSQNGESNDG